MKFEALSLELNSFEAWHDIALLNNPELASLRYALDSADELNRP